MMDHVVMMGKSRIKICRLASYDELKDIQSVSRL